MAPSASGLKTRTTFRGPRHRGFASAMTAVALICLAACGDDDPVKPPGDSSGVLIVTNAAELATALETSGAGDTIEIRAEFTSTPVFTMTKGFSIPAARSPVTILGSAKLGFLRPEIVFPDNVTGITLSGHDGSTIRDLDFRGGRDVIELVDSNALIHGVAFRNNRGDGVHVSGANSTGTIRFCLFENPGVFGVSTANGAPVTIERNTVIHAGDCGFYVGSNVSLIANNIYDAQNFGVFCDSNASSPTLTCNNAFQSRNGNYVCASGGNVGSTNAQVDPRFCPGGYRLAETSPLINSTTCGQIGAFGAEPGCLPGQ